MDSSKQEKSWTITEVVDLVKDLGPRENTAYSYKRLKETLKGFSGPTWEPPGKAQEKALKRVANDGLKYWSGSGNLDRYNFPQTGRINPTTSC